MLCHHDALYRAILDHPDDDTPRLVYADLLEDIGELERAAFIRTQVELARLPEYDPLWTKCRQLNPDAIYGWTQAHTLPKNLPIGTSWRRFAFRRGFPWLAAAGRNALSELVGADLFAVAPIQALAFDGHGYRPDPAHCLYLSRLRRAEFSQSRFDAEDAARFGDSPYNENLNELALEEDGITPEGLQALVESPLFARLKSLELTRNVLPPALLVDALAAAEQPGRLRTLALAESGIDHDDAAHLFALPILRTLDRLDLRDNARLGPDGAVALAESGLLQRLSVVNLSHTLPGVPGVKALTQTRKLAGVRWLDLSANRLGPVAVRRIAESRHVRGLRVLDLSYNPIGDAGAAVLAGSPHLAQLTELVLTDCDIGDTGARALAESPYLTHLLRLDVRSLSRRPLRADTNRVLWERFGPCVSAKGEK